MEITKSSNLLRIAREILGKKASMSEEEGAESGFTLIELMVVLLIMAILLAIAIPTFLGVKTGAQNRAVQSDLSNAVTSGKTVYTNNGPNGYGNGGVSAGNSLAAASTLHGAEPELTFTTGTVTKTVPHQISVLVSDDGQVIIMAEQSQNGSCWYIEDNEEATQEDGGLANATSTQGISYGSNGSPKTSAANCNASDTPGGTDGAFTSSYPAS